MQNCHQNVRLKMFMLLSLDEIRQVNMINHTICWTIIHTMLH